MFYFCIDIEKCSSVWVLNINFHWQNILYYYCCCFICHIFTELWKITLFCQSLNVLCAALADNTVTKNLPKSGRKKDLIPSIRDLPLGKSQLKGQKTYCFITICIREYILGYIQNKATRGKRQCRDVEIGQFQCKYSHSLSFFQLRWQIIIVSPEKAKHGWNNKQQLLIQRMFSLLSSCKLTH